MMGCDLMIRQIFARQEKVPFHHIPEYVNRYLQPADPVVLEYTINLDKDHQTGPKMFDIDVHMEDPAKLHMIQVFHSLDTLESKTKEIVAIDEKIALSASQMRPLKHRRDLLAHFAVDPLDFMETWLESQARDLDMLLSGSDRGRSAAVAGDWTVKSDTLRKSEYFQQDWLDEAVMLYMQRGQHGKLMAARNQGKR